VAIYFQRDIETGLDGDLVVGDNGDLTLADSPDSTSQLLRMLIATDLNELSTSPNFGANIGSLIGGEMRVAMQRLPILIRDGLNKAGYIDRRDVSVEVFPIDVDKLLIIVELKGSYIDDDGQEIRHPAGTIKYYFPYTAERLREWPDA